MIPKFTHLHVHSHYSLLDGLSKIEELLDYTKELGMDAVAITDHGNMHNVIEFYKAAKKKGIKAIIGMEGYVAQGDMTEKQGGQDKAFWHLTLLAKNNEGYKNLIALNTKAALEGFYYKPRFDKALLRRHANGLIALSGCLSAEIPTLIKKNKLDEAKAAITQYLDIFGKGNFYLEVQHHANLPEQMEVNKALYKLSASTGVGLVATQDSHYLKPEDAEAHDILMAIQTGNKLSDEKRMTLKDDDFSLRSPDEMAGHFREHPEAISNTQKIADACNVTIELGKNQLPHFEVPQGYDDSSYLAKLCREGVKTRYAEKVTREIEKRLDYELSVINKTGFASYLLIVADFVNWAKDNGIIVGPGRGSAAGSLVCYLLNITNIDPIRFNLLFERFLNPQRVSMPDIDLDFTDTRRDEVIDYVSKKYGKDRVAQIITFGTMASRVAIRDVGRVLDYPYDYCDKMAKMIPANFSLARAVREVGELKELYEKDADAKRLIDYAQKLEGVARHASTHACGVVITKDPLSDMVPLQHPTQDEKSVITQYEMHSVEDLGLLKMDFLGLRNLTIIENTIREIKRLHKKEIDIDNLPDEDALTFKIFQEANTSGVFQLESSGMRRYLKDLKPTVLEDIIAMVSLYRPGPIELIPEYIARKNGTSRIEYVHPRLEPILKNTYGIMVYQEQLMQVAQDLAGFTLAEADILRKAVGKKIKKLLMEQKSKLIEGFIQNGIESAIAKQLWDFVEPFARYGFNRSHAACYATIAYQTAYLKAHYPIEFVCSLLNAEQKNIDRIAFLIEEARNMNINLLPPSINESGQDFTVINASAANGVIRFGLAAIKNVGANVVGNIIEERERNGNFNSLENILERVTSRDFNKKSLESLIKTGALDEFGERGSLIENINKLLQYSKEHREIQLSGQQGLFDSADSDSDMQKLSLKPDAEASSRQKLSWEKELLGFYVSGHPLKEYSEALKNLMPIGNLTRNTLSRVRIGAIISNTKKIITKNGQPMMFINLEDLTGKIEAIVFPSLFQNKQNLLEERKIILVEGKISKREQDGEPKLLCDNIQELV